ncbi:MAG TPA: glycoside hydrolase family 15 protein, partial [Blastocatellia bacterium]
TIDASLFGVWYFGVLDADDPMVESTMRAVEERLWVKTEVGGMARYENDTYYQVSQDIANVPGNPWFICTLWLAQYRIARAKKSEELKEALGLMKWVTDHALDSGVLAEQVHPHTDAPLSVSPLTWSHAQYVTAVMEYLHKLFELKRRESIGQPVLDERRDPNTMPARMEEFRLKK